MKRICSSLKGWFTAFVAIQGLGLSAALSQQFFTDDAGISGTFQLEAWHGSQASWFVPAARIVPHLELSAGLGLVGSTEEARSTDFALQMKAEILPMDTSIVAVAFSCGLAAGSLDPSNGKHFKGVYVNAPLTLFAVRERLTVHANLGWHNFRISAQDDEQQFTWGLRTDLVVIPGIQLMGEILQMQKATAEFQIGVHFEFIADQLKCEVSWGDHIEKDIPGVGLVIGLTWTPPDF